MVFIIMKQQPGIYRLTVKNVANRNEVLNTIFEHEEGRKKYEESQKTAYGLSDDSGNIIIGSYRLPGSPETKDSPRTESGRRRKLQRGDSDAGK